MIKLKKIVAVALSAAMCLGLSMTAFAAREDTVKEWDSEKYMQSNLPSTEANARGDFDGAAGVAQWGQNGRRLGSNASAWVSDVTDNKGTKLEWSAGALTKQQLAGINSEKKVRDLFAKAGYDIDDDWDLVPALATSVTLDQGIGSDGAYAWIDLDEWAQTGSETRFHAGDMVPVLREIGANTGNYEVVMVEMVERNGLLQGRIQVTAQGQGFVVVRVMNDGNTVRVTNTKTGESVYVKPAEKSTSTNASASSSPATSPKTGEF